MRTQFQPVMPMTKTVKNLIIVNVSIWVGLVLILQQMVLQKPYMFVWFGFVPEQALHQFWVWQFFSYMFVHSPNVFHVVFNMLLLWWLGSELELYWGRRFFLTYYLGCGIGAAVLYLIAVSIYVMATGNSQPMLMPVVGASGAIFGLILAYGIIFGERVIYFMMLFPMKARHFVMIIGGIELLNLMSEGFSSQVSNLAHLGGLVSGYILLKMTPKIHDFWLRRRTMSYGRRLKLVVDNDDRKKSQGGNPRFWN